MTVTAEPSPSLPQLSFFILLFFSCLVEAGGVREQLDGHLAADEVNLAQQ